MPAETMLPSVVSLYVPASHSPNSISLKTCPNTVSLTAKWVSALPVPCALNWDNIFPVAESELAADVVCEIFMKPSHCRCIPPFCNQKIHCWPPDEVGKILSLGNRFQSIERFLLLPINRLNKAITNPSADHLENQELHSPTDSSNHGVVFGLLWWRSY